MHPSTVGQWVKRNVKYVAYKCWLYYVLFNIMFFLFAVSAITLLTGSRCEYGMKMMTSSLVWSRDWNASQMISWGRQSLKSVLWVERWMCGTTLVSRALGLKTYHMLVWEYLRALGCIWTVCKEGRKKLTWHQGTHDGAAGSCKALIPVKMKRGITYQKGDGFSLSCIEKYIG